MRHCITVPRRLKPPARRPAPLIVAGSASASVESIERPGRAEPVPPSLAAAIEQITSKPQYAHSSWGLRVEDRTTGEVLLDQAGEAMFTTGSILKVYSTSTALHLYGSDHTFTHARLPHRPGPQRRPAWRPRARGFGRLLHGSP